MALEHEVALIGAPSDAGAGQPGGRDGPAALRAAGLQDALQRAGCRVHDAGDLRGPPPGPADHRQGYRHLEAVQVWCAEVHDAVLAALTAGRRPLLLGGDHSLAIGSISAVARHCRARGRPLHVLWFDAHADCNSRRTSPSANLHGMPVACLHGIGPPALSQLSGQTPALRPGQLQLIGVRSIDPGEAELVRTLRLPLLDLQTLRAQGARVAMVGLLAQIEDDAHLHVSLDLDFLDPQTVPGTGTPVGNGATLAEALDCLQAVAASGRLGSADLVELLPRLDPDGRSVRHAVALLTALFGPSLHGSR